MLPFTIEQFFDVFEAYNLATFPAPWMLSALALIAVGVIFYRGGAAAGKATSAILSALWLWAGVVYHLQFFTQINGAAYLFGLLFIAQAFVFVFYGWFKGGIQLRIHLDSRTVAGMVLIVYSLMVYPLLGYAFGHTYPRAPTFGTPCPTSIFTFGMLMFLDRRPPIYLYAIPVIWAIIGTTAAFLFGIYEDLGLLLAAIVATLGMLSRTSK